MSFNVDLSFIMKKFSPVMHRPSNNSGRLDKQGINNLQIKGKEIPYFSLLSMKIQFPYFNKFVHIFPCFL